MMKKLLQYKNLVFAAGGAVLVLWSLLLPGYVFLLDYVVGPHSIFSYSELSQIVSGPSRGLIYGLEQIFPVWIVQKGVLFGMVFVLFYFPLRFYPFARKHGVEYFAATFFALNPFVYERLLAGQWRVIVGYAFLFPLMYFLVRFAQDHEWRSLRGAVLTVLVTGMWSIHFLVISIIIVGVFALVECVRAWRCDRGRLRALLTQFLGGGFLFLVVSLYWIVPHMVMTPTTLDEFGSAHWEAFATAGDARVGVVGNVLAMRGFWGEDHAWAEQFTMPGGATFYLGFAIIIALSAYGVRMLWREVRERATAVFFLLVLVLSAVFATGVSAYGLWVINQWLFEHVGFWGGFRDAQKWVGVVVVVYVLLATYGLQKLLATLTSHRTRTRALMASLLVPVFLVPQLPLGLGGQVAPAWYPESWAHVDEILSDDEKCRAVFLPWHQYYVQSFAHNQLTANPARAYFDCDVIAGQNTELGAITSIAGDVEGYHDLERALTTNDDSDDAKAAVISQLHARGVRYVIVAHDLTERDLYRYPFLQTDDLQVLFSDAVITLYAVR